MTTTTLVGDSERPSGRLTSRDVGERLGLSGRQVYRLVDDGVLGVVRIGRQLWFSAEDVEALAGAPARLGPSPRSSVSGHPPERVPLPVVDDRYRIHRIQEGDEDVLATLARGNGRFTAEGEDGWLPPLGTGEASRFVNDDRTFCMVAVDVASNHIAGFVYGCVLFRRHTKLEHLCIYELGVDTDHPYDVVGKVLLTTLLDAARNEGLDRAFVITAASDKRAVELYQSMGAMGTAGDDVLFGIQF